MKKVILVFRKPYPSSYSIEYLFHELADEFYKRSIPLQTYYVPAYSKGLYNRMKNVFSLFLFPNKIVHITGDVYYAILGAWFSKRIITIHDLHFLDRTKGITRFILKWFWVKLPVYFSHKVTVISEATKRELHKYVNLPASKIDVIPDFIDAIYQPVRREFNNTCPKVLLIGCSFNKNLYRIIQALSVLHCELIIIGTLSDSQTSHIDSHKLKYKSKFNLTLKELHQQYIEADLLCFASTIEGFGMPIIEAQASGLPVVTSDCSSMPEVAGKGAILVNPYEINSIRNGVKTIIEDSVLRKALVEKGYDNAKRFTKAAAAAAYIKVYKTL